MADATFDSGKQSTPYLTDFPAKVQYGWFRSGEPDAVVSCEKQPDVYICLNGGVNCRIVGKTGVYEWKFNIFTTGGKQLRNVALLSNDFRDNFDLKIVKEDGIEIGVTNGNEWHNPSIVNTFDPCKKRYYMVTIAFTASNHGTYRQNVIFGFRRNPVYLQKICADYLPINDYKRIQLATKYQISQMSPIWGNPYEFDSVSFMSFYTDPREIKLSKIYPLPDKQNFFLTQDTLSKKELTPQNYRGRWHEMITLEEIARHEQLSRYNHISYVRLLSSYELTTNNSTETKYAPPGELFAQLLTNRDILEDTQSGRVMQRSCNSVLLKMRPNNNSEHRIFHAYIEDKCPPFLFVRLSKDCVNFWHSAEHTDVQLEVQFVLNRLNFCEWHLAVDALTDVNLVFLRNEHLQIDKQIIHNFLQIDANDLNFLSTLMLNSVFNQEQKQAATVMTLPVSNTPSAPVLLLGPFGTGKTFTLAHVLYLLVQNPDNRILLCTHSNSAADLYIKECFHFWYTKNKNPRFKPVRIYYKRRALNTVHPIVRQYCLMEEHQVFRDPEEKDLRDCGLIVTTLATSSCLIKLDLDLTHIIIDEAAQAFECEALVALTLANAHTRLILAGDHMQLAPEIYSVLANNLGLGISLLERMNNFYPPNHPCRIHLCHNYRAHKDIIDYTSKTFYNGKVKSANTESLQRHPILKPLTFYAVNGSEKKDVYSTGYYNELEAQMIAGCVEELKNTWPTEQWGPYGEGSIGVLAYYPEQVLTLRKELRNRYLSDVSVERVLNVQGKQFTAVFISTVRTKTCDRLSAEAKVKDYGFLTDPRLLNTALTRAKCLVAVFGDPIALLTIGSCKEHWKKYMEVASLKGIDLEQIKACLMDVPKLQMCPLNPLAEVFVPRIQPATVIRYVQIPVAYNVPVISYIVSHPPQTNVLMKTNAVQNQNFTDFSPLVAPAEYCRPF